MTEELGILPKADGGVEINVIGGHSAETMVPLFSQASSWMGCFTVRSQWIPSPFHVQGDELVLISVLGNRRPTRRRRNIPGKGRNGICNFVDCLCYIPVIHHLFRSVSNHGFCLLTIPHGQACGASMPSIEGRKRPP